MKSRQQRKAAAKGEQITRAITAQAVQAAEGYPAERERTQRPTETAAMRTSAQGAGGTWRWWGHDGPYCFSGDNMPRVQYDSMIFSGPRVDPSSRKKNP